MLIVLEHLLGRINLPGMWWIISERWREVTPRKAAALFVRRLFCVALPAFPLAKLAKNACI